MVYNHFGLWYAGYPKELGVSIVGVVPKNAWFIMENAMIIRMITRGYPHDPGNHHNYTYWGF